MSLSRFFKSVVRFGLIAGGFAAIVALSGLAVVQVVMRTGRVVEVPNVVGESFYTASKRLDEVGLRIDAEREEYNPVVQAGNIIYQRPAAGSKVKTSRVVLVVVSLGSEKIAVPDVTGEELRQVAGRVIIPPKLKVSRLAVGHVSQIHYPAKERLILAQNPPAKSPIESGGKVDLLVSAGPRRARYLVPDVTGMKRDEAVQMLARLNFEIKTDPEYQPQVERNIVLKQHPEPNVALEEGGLVRLAVSARRQDKKWENLRYLVLAYQVPLGISPRLALHARPGFLRDLARVERLVRIEMTDALGTETVLLARFNPGEVIVETVSYKEEAIVKVFVDGVLQEQAEANGSGERTFTFVQPWENTYATEDSTIDSLSGLR